MLRIRYRGGGRLAGKEVNSTKALCDCVMVMGYCLISRWSLVAGPRCPLGLSRSWWTQPYVLPMFYRLIIPIIRWKENPDLVRHRQLSTESFRCCPIQQPSR